MATYLNYVANPNMQVTASLRETITDVRNAFLSCSFTRTVQSGSVDNIDTLIPPTTTNTQITYDIFAFNDSWQSTNPLFIKVRYMTGVSSQHFALACQMGSVHNNSGSLIGVDTLTEIGTGGSATAQTIVASSIHGCGDGSFMTLTVFPQLAYSQFFVFERFYDITGQPTGSGFHMIGHDAATAVFWYSHATLYGQGPATRETNYIANSRPSRVPALYNGRLVLGLTYPFAGRPWNPSPNLLIGSSTDFPNTFQQTPYTVYNSERRYVNYLPSRIANAVYSGGRLLIRSAP